MPTLNINHLNPGTPDHVQVVLANKHRIDVHIDEIYYDEHGEKWVRYRLDD